RKRRGKACGDGIQNGRIHCQPKIQTSNAPASGEQLKKTIKGRSMLTVDHHASKSAPARTHPARSTNKNPRCDPPDAKRIVIVDDHPLFPKGLAELIHSEKNHFAVCGEAGSAAEAMEVIRRLNPGLAIVDLSLPGANGIELIKNIRAEFSKMPILVLSMHDESLYAVRALRAGANGYVMKQEAL